MSWICGGIEMEKEGGGGIEALPPHIKAHLMGLFPKSLLLQFWPPCLFFSGLSFQTLTFKKYVRRFRNEKTGIGHSSLRMDVAINYVCDCSL